MKSRAASQVLIEKEVGYLITVVSGTKSVPVAVSRNVKDAYAFAKLAGRISEPNKSYKTCVRAIQKDLLFRMWDASVYDSEHDYMLNYVNITPVKLI